MFKHLKIIYLLIITILISTINVYAENIDPNKISSITGFYSYSDKKLTNANVYLYKIANLDEKGNFTYLNNYKEFPKDINNYTSSEWNDYTKELANFIKNQNINYDNNSLTDLEGKFYFNDLTTGLYLVIIDSIEDDNYRYKSSPVLISVPNYNQIENYYMYDLSVVMKTEAESIKIDEAPSDNNKTDSPNTYDAIIKYTCIFIIALLVLAVLVCYIYKIRKDVNKNEKQKNNQKNN